MLQSLARSAAMAGGPSRLATAARLPLAATCRSSLFHSTASASAPLPASAALAAILSSTNTNGHRLNRTHSGLLHTGSALTAAAPSLHLPPHPSASLSTAAASSSSSSSPATRLTTADIRAMRGFIVDMDGVLYHMQKVIPGALDFIAWLKASNKRFLFLTNSSERSPRELQEKLRRLGIEVGVEHFYTSALATAAFLARQKPGGSAYVIGEPGLMQALYDVNYSMNDVNPDYVIVGETRNYNYAMLETAVALVRRGARLIGTNVDITDRSQDSYVPACGSLCKPIELASGRVPYYIGKPNPLIMRAALDKLQVSRSDACIIGDRLDTDILAGVQSEIRTVLVLSGVTTMADVPLAAYRPDCILPSVGSVLDDVGVEVDEAQWVAQEQARQAAEQHNLRTAQAAQAAGRKNKMAQAASNGNSSSSSSNTSHSTTAQQHQHSTPEQQPPQPQPQLQPQA